VQVAGSTICILLLRYAAANGLSAACPDLPHLSGEVGRHSRDSATQEAHHPLNEQENLVPAAGCPPDGSEVEDMSVVRREGLSMSPACVASAHTRLLSHDEGHSASVPAAAASLLHVGVPTSNVPSCVGSMASKATQTSLDDSHCTADPGTQGIVLAGSGHAIVDNCPVHRPRPSRRQTEKASFPLLSDQWSDEGTAALPDVLSLRQTEWLRRFTRFPR
jgi:hypothetical protein